VAQQTQDSTAAQQQVEALREQRALRKEHDGEMDFYYGRARNQLSAAWHMPGSALVVSSIAITTIAITVSTGNVSVPVFFLLENDGGCWHWPRPRPPCTSPCL
jgi:hypothetical protein